MNEIERAADALHHIDAGCARDEWVRAGMAAKSAGLSFDDFHNWSASAGNYAGENECRTVWKSFDDSGAVTPATLYGMAFAQGWKDPSKSRAKGSNGSRPSLPLARVKQTPQTPVKQAENANAVAVWERCIAATAAEAYIHRKQGKPDGLRVYPASASPLVIRGQNVAGYLAVPCWSGNTLRTLQFIPPGEGKKLFLPMAQTGDGFFTVGEITDRVYICEGIGTAWACNTATGAAAVVTFGSGRMATVAKALREKYPAARLVIVPDKGQESKAEKIAADVAGLMVTMPADKPGNYDAWDYLHDTNPAALAALLECIKAPAMRYALLSDDDLCKLPPLQWRIKKVLPQTGLAAVYGASGSGKSFAVLDALQSMAAGRDWFGYKTKPCNVLYCALEGEGGIAGRVAAYRIRHGVTSQNIRYLVQPFSLLDEADILDLAQAIHANGQGAEVVVLDTLNRAAPGADENDSKSMGQIIAAAKELQTLVGGLVVLVHHVGKDASKGLRGHSSLHAALDAAIEVRRDGDRREWVIAKSKDGEDGEAHPFKLDVVELGTDEDGEPITSCVVHPLEQVAEALRRPLPPKSGNQRAVWDTLGEIFRKAGNVKPEGAPDTLPQGRPCITLEAAIEQTRTRLVCDPKRQTERAQAAIRGLVDRGILCHEGGFVWCK
jgi:hypothetical protein